MVDNGGLQFYPPRLWGLDYQFSVYNKMYIADVVNMPEYPKFPGAYCYNNHPIYKVDVLGIIVKKSENSKCFIYAVDDGTGVVLCCCWKENFTNPAGCAAALSSLPSCLKDKVKDIQHDITMVTEGYSLGDLVQVKGRVKVFRDQKEVVANFHKKVDNPMFQVFRMLELPRLYRLNLDKPFVLPKKVQAAVSSQRQGEPSKGQSQAGTVALLKDIIFHHISQSESLIDLDPNDILKLSKVKVILTEAGEMKTEEALSLILQALSLLEDNGSVTRRSDRRMLYEVLVHRSKLERKVLMILSEEASKPKYSMTGCHYLHVLDELHKTYQYARVKRAAVMYCLQKLEAQSDILRTTHAHYLPCGF